MGITYWYLPKKTLFFSFNILSPDSLGGDSPAQSAEVTLALLKDCGLKTETVLSSQASHSLHDPFLLKNAKHTLCLWRMAGSQLPGNSQVEMGLVSAKEN